MNEFETEGKMLSFAFWVLRSWKTRWIPLLEGDLGTKSSRLIYVFKQLACVCLQSN